MRVSFFILYVDRVEVLTDMTGRVLPIHTNRMKFGGGSPTTEIKWTIGMR